MRRWFERGVCALGRVAIAAGMGALVAGPLTEAAAQITAFDERVTTAGNIGLTVSNYARQGNDFRNRSSSFEFPARSGEEHMTRGGIWIGGIVLNAADASLDTLVTTSVSDDYGGAELGSSAEFTPVRGAGWPPGTSMLERSAQPSSAFFSPQAIADQEFVAICVDTVRVGTGVDRHRPLNVKLRQEALVWGFNPYDGIVFINFELTNLSRTRNVFDVYVGLYTELTSGNKDAADRWPPPGAWYGTKNIAWVDSLRYLAEQRAPGLSGDPYEVSSWCGAQMLGISTSIPGDDSTIDDKTTTFVWWEWQDETPETDRERYEVMSSGETTPTQFDEFSDLGADPVSLTSIGPFSTLSANEADTVRFSIAYIGGLDAEDLNDRAKIALDAYRQGFRIPKPPPAPDYLVEPGPNEITIRWDDTAERTPDPQTGLIDFEGYRLYLGRSSESTALDLLKEVDVVDDYTYSPDATQEDIRFNTGLESVLSDDPIIVVDGEDTLRYVYEYVIRDLRDGFKYWTSLTAFDKGTQEIGPLESGLALTQRLSIPGSSPVPVDDGSGRVSVFPNPYRGSAAWDGEQLRDRYLWFRNLPQRARIRIYTLGGDLVDSFDFDGDTYDARDVRGIYDPTDPRNPEIDLPVMSGGMAAWDLITRDDQAIATGLYLFSVEDLATGRRDLGKFLVLK